MTFQNDRISDFIKINSNFRHNHKTEVFIAASGFEQRNSLWSQTRGEGDFGYPFIQKLGSVAGKATIEEIIKHHRTKLGKLHSFPFKDWSDFDIGDQADPSGTRQTIGTGDAAETAFQVFKRYTSGGTNLDRTIYILTTGTLFVYLDGILKADPADYTVNLNTGLITFGSAPGSSVDVAVTVQFYNHVRYDIDALDIALHNFAHGRIPNIPVIEVRGAGT